MHYRARIEIQCEDAVYICIGCFYFSILFTSLFKISIQSLKEKENKKKIELGCREKTKLGLGVSGPVFLLSRSMKFLHPYSFKFSFSISLFLYISFFFLFSLKLSVELQNGRPRSKAEMVEQDTSCRWAPPLFVALSERFFGSSLLFSFILIFLFFLYHFTLYVHLRLLVSLYIYSSIFSVHFL